LQDPVWEMNGPGLSELPSSGETTHLGSPLAYLTKTRDNSQLHSIRIQNDTPNYSVLLDYLIKQKTI